MSGRRRRRERERAAIEVAAQSPLPFARVPVEQGSEARPRDWRAEAAVLLELEAYIRGQAAAVDAQPIYAAVWKRPGDALRAAADIARGWAIQFAREAVKGDERNEP